MQCPNCNSELVHTHPKTIGLLDAEACPQCGGCWVTAAGQLGLEP